MTPAAPIILDCDPGHDDAIAIVVAARHTELLGITTVAGNAPLERTTHNALVVRDLLGIDVPVHSGAARPLRRRAARRRRRPRRERPRRRRPARADAGRSTATDAVGFIVETCRSQPRACGSSASAR